MKTRITEYYLFSTKNNSWIVMGIEFLEGISDPFNIEAEMRNTCVYVCV